MPGSGAAGVECPGLFLGAHLRQRTRVFPKLFVQLPSRLPCGPATRRFVQMQWLRQHPAGKENRLQAIKASSTRAGHLPEPTGSLPNGVLCLAEGRRGAVSGRSVTAAAQRISAAPRAQSGRDCSPKTEHPGVRIVLTHLGTMMNQGYSCPST